MHTVYLQWKHGEISDREFNIKLDSYIRMNASMVGMAGIAYKDKNLVRCGDDLRDLAQALRMFAAARKERQHAH